MVQAADLWKGDNSASIGWLYGPRLRTILAEREDAFGFGGDTQSMSTALGVSVVR